MLEAIQDPDLLAEASTTSSSYRNIKAPIRAASSRATGRLWSTFATVLVVSFPLSENLLLPFLSGRVPLRVPLL